MYYFRIINSHTLKLCVFLINKIEKIAVESNSKCKISKSVCVRHFGHKSAHGLLQTPCSRYAQIELYAPPIGVVAIAKALQFSEIKRLLSSGGWWVEQLKVRYQSFFDSMASRK